MCQVNGPTPRVGCSKCGAGYYEGDSHTCKVLVPFKVWDAQLQERAKQEYAGTNHLLATARRATQTIASWPEWKRHLVWSEEYQFSV